jgi:hypothetical protein
MGAALAAAHIPERHVAASRTTPLAGDPPARNGAATHGALRLPGVAAGFRDMPGAQGGAAGQPLSFFKNYFVTGDHVVRGVSLWRKGINGKAVAAIPALRAAAAGGDGVPERADIVAAFLYIQTAERIQGSGVDYLNVRLKFNGFDFGPFLAEGSTVPGSGTLAKPLNWDDATPTCWSVNVPGGRRLVTYRADVLRFLPIDPNTGKQSLTATHRIELPDWGFRFKDDEEGSVETQNEYGPRAVGASIVVVYRDRTQPLRGITLYDGGATKRAYQTIEQRLEGFYQSLTAGTTAKVSHLVGDGRWFLSERVRTSGEKNGVAGPITTVTNPFRSLQGPKWDTWTSQAPLPPDADAVKVRVEPHSLLSDCTSWSAMVLSTRVQDTDSDGLLDAWETDGALVDPNGQPLPNLPAMGADPAVKNVFIEIGHMTAASLTYGGTLKPPHSHLPSAGALQQVADAFDRKGIKVHFDVGNRYQDLNNGGPPPHVIPAHLARGGEEIDEMVTVCPRDPLDPSVCQFADYPGTVGWKSGFRLLRDQILAGGPNGEPIPSLVDGEDPCDEPGSACVRRFDRNRKDIFHYALFAHAIGMPKEPCFVEDAAGNVVLDANGNPTTDLSCPGADPNSEFFVPRTNSGIADFPGGDMLITLGAFDDSNGLPIGTPYMQAATLMHELGHNLELTHAGPPAFPVREPNCKPNYLSVMNYLFQLRGLLDADGVPQLDFSDGVLGPINEQGLFDGPFAEARFRTGWYAPLETSYLQGFASPATKHCDGSELLKDANGTLLERPMVRVDSLGLASLGIDWNADGFVNAGGIVDAQAGPSGVQDVNFNGLELSLNAGANDWNRIRLNELGGRRSVGAFFKHEGRFYIGPLSLDVGRGDIGRGDIGRGDIGRGDIGRGDIGRGDIGRGDIGRGDIGRGDIGRGDIGRGDIGRGDIGRGDFGGGDMDVGAPSEIFNGELDFETFVAVTGGQAPTPASALRACLTNDGVCTTDGGDVPVRLTWLAPNVGQAVGYEIYRFVVNPEGPFPPTPLPSEPLDVVFGLEGPVPTTYLDDSAENGVTYAYFVVALLAGESRSGISNFAAITTPQILETGIVNIEMSSTILTIGGDEVPYTARVANATGEPLSNVTLRALIQQDSQGAVRSAGSTPVLCGPTEGTLPPGSCAFGYTAATSNASPGSGTLQPGSATAVFELVRFNGETTTLLDTFTVPVTLVVLPALSVAWAVQPPDTDAGGGFGSAVQVTVLDALSSTPVQGATVAMSLDGNPAGVTLGGTTSAVTDVNGRATFTNLPIDFGGEFSLLASASMAGYAPDAETSDSFVVEGWGPEFTAPFGGGHEATPLTDGRVLLTRDGDRQAVLFDPATRTFSNTGQMNVLRQDHTATLLANGRVLIAGGVQPGAEPIVLDSAEIYDPATQTFSVIDAQMAVARYDHRATLLADGRVLFTGGQDSVTCCSTVALTELFDPATGAFDAGPSLTDSRHLHTATLLGSGVVLIAGGRRGVGEGVVILGSAELFDPAGSITAAGNLNFARTSHTATLLQNGQVLIAGGFGAGGATASAEEFNPATSVFLTTESGLGQPRYLHAAELLQNGRVLISGGWNAVAAALTSAERYVPSSGSFLTTMSMTSGRVLHQLVQLMSGHVLATGGGGGATAEIYYVKPVSF